MTTAKKQEMTARIANQVAKLTAKGVEYDKALTIVFEDINKRWPLAMAAFCNV